MPTPDLGCRTNSTNINTTTMQGNRSTTPSGMEMLELPFNRNGRRKKASLELVFALVLTSAMVGICGDDGIRFITLWTKPILCCSARACWEARIGGGCLPRNRQSALQQSSYYKGYSESQGRVQDGTFNRTYRWYRRL